MNTYNTSPWSFRNRTRSMEFMRTFITDYNQTIRTHNDMMLEYNRNVTSIIDILNRSPDAPPPTPTNRSSSRADIATLIHLLSQAGPNERPVGLSRTQIESATHIVAYVTDNFNTTQCPISLDEFVENEMVCQIIHCRHIFKRRNIMRWLETNAHCPVCRYDLREPEENTNIWSNLFNQNTDVSVNDVYTFEFPLRFNGRSW